MKLRLKDGREFEVVDGTASGAIRMELDSLDGIENVRETFTKENLASFQFTDDAGKVYGEYGHHVLERVSYSETDAGKFLAVFHIRELTETELRLDALEDGQETQNGAIEELAALMGGGE